MNLKKIKKSHKKPKGEKTMTLSLEQVLEVSKEIAKDAHEGQIDKGGHPYILHPERVAARMDTLEEKIVAWLHDVVEDSNWTFEDLINKGVPAYLVESVDAITKREGEDKNLYLYRLSKNEIASRVKRIGDIQENRDLSRIPSPTEKDYARAEEYKRRADILEGAGVTYIFQKTKSGYKWKHVKNI